MNTVEIKKLIASLKNERLGIINGPYSSKLRELGPMVIPFLIETFHMDEIESCYIWLIVSFGEPAIPFLEAALHSEDYETKSQSMEALWQMPEHATQIYATIVSVATNDHNRHIRTKARVLGDKIKTYMESSNN